MTRIPTSTPSDRESARRARVAAIQAGAVARQALGITATYRELPNGQHQVTARDAASGQVRIGTGGTLSEAIDRARRAQT